MKKLLNSLFISLSMYSILPAPQKAWDENSMKYVMAFMPIPGLICGILMYLFVSLGGASLNSLLFAAIMALIPVLITGGLHLDGFADTVDAISSHKDMETKLKILKDPNAGAFAVIYTASYFLLMAGLWAHYGDNPVFPLAIPLLWCLSKIMGALFVVSLTPARKSGLAYMFNDGADKKWSRNVLFIEFFAVFALIYMLNIELFALISIITAALTVIFVRQTKRIFGGITGDLIGFFICMAELIFAGILVIFSLII